MATETKKGKRAKSTSSESLLNDIRRNTKRIFSSEQKVLIVMEGIRGELSVAELCRKYGISDSTYYKWNKEFIEAGKARLEGDILREATSSEVQELRFQNQELKLALAELVLRYDIVKRDHCTMNPFVASVLSSRFLLLDAVFFNLGVLPLYPDLVSNEPQNPRFEDTSPRSGQKELLISKLENLYKLRKHNERRDKLIEWTCAMVSFISGISLLVILLSGYIVYRRHHRKRKKPMKK